MSAALLNSLAVVALGALASEGGNILAAESEAGAPIYKSVCQGCHMSEAQGARGAGNYPALTDNARLRSTSYTLNVVANGQRAMPRLGAFLSDVQIADVVNYVRTHFGNHYSDAVSGSDVKRLRKTPADAEQ